MKAAYRITILVDEVPFKYKQYWQLLKLTLTIWNRISSLRRICVLFWVSFSYAAKNWKSLNYEIRHEKKHEKNLGPTKYPYAKLLDAWNTHEKSFRYTKFLKEKIFGPMQYPWVKSLDPQKGTMARCHQTHKNQDGKRLKKI